MPELPAVYRTATTHPTWAREQGGPHNQRLEFLGDAVLKLLVAELLCDEMPEADEGQLSKVLHQLVDNELLARLARERGLGALLRLGIGEERQGGRDRDSNLADLFEALLGAVYLDQGLDAARDVVQACLQHEVGRAQTRRNARSALQIWAERRGLGVPDYVDVGAEGPDHQRVFLAEVHVAGACWGRGKGPKKRKAYAAAAAEALARIADGSVSAPGEGSPPEEPPCGP